MKSKIASLVLVAITIISCNTSKTTSDTSDSVKPITKVKSFIEDTKWVMSTLDGHQMVTGKNSQDIHFTLSSIDNRVNGFSGCNTFMGTYKIEMGNRISFSQMGMTRMACPDAAINETQILSIFEIADNFTITDNQLALNKAKSAPLAVFKKADTDLTSVVEKYWKLKTLAGKDIKMANNQQREIFFTLKSQDNRVTGFAGCNSFSGSYTLEAGDRIHFSNMATTMRACPDVDVNDSDLLQVFEVADNYTVVDDILSLNVGTRAPLAVFEAVYMD